MNNYGSIGNGRIFTPVALRGLTKSNFIAFECLIHQIISTFYEETNHDISFIQTGGDY